MSPTGSPYALLQTADFVADLSERLAGAKQRILIQLMTFDGDDAGQRIAELLVSAIGRGVEVRLLVDCFVFRFVSDQPVSRHAVADEAAATRAMYERLRAAGAALRFTHPHGPGNVFSLVRNHKKLFVVDDDVYLGGVNISDHNFAWHDFMVRIDDPEVLAAVVEDFDHTFAGGRRSVNDVIVTNDRIEEVFDDLVLGAERRIVLASPYAIDVGLVGLMRRAEVSDKTVIATKRNNFLVYRAMAPFLRRRLRHAGVDLASYSNFSHSKFLLVDDDKLLIGSSNFGRHSFWCNEELCLLIEDPEFIRRFSESLLQGIEPLDERPSLVKVAFGACISYLMHVAVFGLRLTVASRVPNLSRR